METQPMKASELGQYVCVAHGGCLNSPNRTITSDGVWVKCGTQFSSAHRDCFNAWQEREWREHITVHGNEPSLDEFQRERTEKMSKELTYSERTRFSNEQVTERMKELMIPVDYPTEDLFSESEILTEVSKLSDYQLYEDVATLKQGDYEPQVIVKFGELAKALGSTICNQYGELKIRRETTHAQRRSSAVSNLAQRLTQERKDTAIRTLLDEE